jgi:transcriptional regulator with XRE-family HTH domain
MLRIAEQSVPYSFTGVENYVQYTAQGKVHIGKTIRHYMDENGLRFSSFADRIKISRSGLYNIFGSASIDTDRLLAISRVSGHNFFKYYSELLEESDPPLELVKEEKQPYEPKKERIILDFEDGELIERRKEDGDVEDRLERMEQKQQEFFEKLYAMLPALGKKMAENPDVNPLNEDVPSDLGND